MNIFQSPFISKLSKMALCGTSAMVLVTGGVAEASSSQTQPGEVGSSYAEANIETFLNESVNHLDEKDSSDLEVDAESEAQAKSSRSEGISTSGIVIGGGVGLALAGGAAAVLISGGDEESTSNKSEDNPVRPYDPPPPPGPGPGPGGPHTEFETEEYMRSTYNTFLNTSKVYAEGYTGEGVTVGVVGGGVDLFHSELYDNIVDPYNVIDDSSDVRYSRTNGTHIAGLIGAKKDDKGMHGIAYDANLMPVSMADRENRNRMRLGGRGEYLAKAINYSVDNGASIIHTSFNGEYDESLNNAKGVSEAEIRLFLPEFMDSIDNAVENDTVMVFPVGDGHRQPNPDLPAMLPAFVSGIQENWIAVGALSIGSTSLEESNRSMYTNYCGDARDWCLFAPGSGMLGPSAGEEDYREMNGRTSRPAAVVAGSVALIRQMYPHMESHEITALLFETADKIGWDPHIYGQGILNLERAFQPAGEVSVPQGTTVNGSTASLKSSSLQSSPAFGDGIAHALSGETMMGLDEYGRGFQFDMANFVGQSNQTTRRDALNQLKLFGGLEERSITTIDAGPLSLTTASRLQSDAPGLGQSGYSRMTFGFTGQGYSIAASLNPDMGRNFGFREAGFGSAPMMEKSSFNQPHLALMETGYASSAGFDIGGSSHFRAGAFVGNMAPDRLSLFSNTPSVMGAVGEWSSTVADNTIIKASLGAISEEGSLLGTVSRGAFGDQDIKSDTTFGTVGGVFGLRNDISLTLTGSIGNTNFKQDSGIIQSGSNLITSSFGVGMSKKNLWNDSDRVSLAVSQPLRVESGKVNLSVPTSRDIEGNIGYTRTSLSPQPTGREVNLQASYGFDVMDGVEASIGAMHRVNAGHVKGKHESTGVVSFSMSF